MKIDTYKINEIISFYNVVRALCASWLNGWAVIAQGGVKSMWVWDWKLKMTREILLLLFNFFYTRLKFYSSLIKLYMCMKFPPRELNPNSYPPHPTSTYTCGLTIVSKMCSDMRELLISSYDYSFPLENETNINSIKKKTKNIYIYYVLFYFMIFQFSNSLL